MEFNIIEDEPTCSLIQLSVQERGIINEVVFSVFSESLENKEAIDPNTPEAEIMQAILNPDNVDKLVIMDLWYEHLNYLRSAVANFAIDASSGQLESVKKLALDLNNAANVMHGAHLHHEIGSQEIDAIIGATVIPDTPAGLSF